MTGQPAHCLCIWRIPVQIRLSVSSTGQESAPFWAAPVTEKLQLPRKPTQELHVEFAQGLRREVTDSSYQSRGKNPQCQIKDIQVFV